MTLSHQVRLLYLTEVVNHTCPCSLGIPNSDIYSFSPIWNCWRKPVQNQKIQMFVEICSPLQPKVTAYSEICSREYLSNRVIASRSWFYSLGKPNIQGMVWDFYVKVCTWTFTTIVSLSKFHVGLCDACSQFRGWGGLIRLTYLHPNPELTAIITPSVST
jgi:hypothetical protein